MKDKIVSVRFTQDEYADLEWRAKQLGVSVSELIRRSAKPRASISWMPNTKTYSTGASYTASIIWNQRG